jgi:hypothetical protein
MKEEQIQKMNWFDKQANQFEEVRLGFMAFFVVSQSCLGSIVAAYTIKVDSTVLLAICATVTGASNAAFIAQAPAKWCLALFYTSIIVDLVLILICAI